MPSISGQWWGTYTNYISYKNLQIVDADKKTNTLLSPIYKQDSEVVKCISSYKFIQNKKHKKKELLIEYIL